MKVSSLFLHFLNTDITVGWMGSSVSPLLYFLLLVIFPPEMLKCYDSGTAHTAGNDNASYVITNQDSSTSVNSKDITY